MKIKYLIISIIAIVVFSNIAKAQKVINPTVYTSGAPVSCLYGRIYIDVTTGFIYAYKTGIGCFLSGTGISGAGSSGKVAFWNSGVNVTYNANFIFDGTNLSIPTGGQFRINGTAFNFSNLAGNIVISQMNSGTNASSSTYWRGDGTWASLPASGATTALDNLASVNINASLLFQSGLDVGSTIKPIRDLYLYGSGTYGTNYFRFTGTPTSTRIITLPDLASYTLAQITNAQTFAGNQTFSGNILSNTDGGSNIGNGAASRFNIYAYALSDGGALQGGEIRWGGTTNKFRFSPPNLQMGSSVNIGWSSGDPASVGVDIGLSRNAAGIIEINNGTTGTYRDLKSRHIIGGSSTPTCSVGASGVVGSSATCSVSGNDFGGEISLTATGTPVSAGTIVTLTFNTAYLSAPKCPISPSNDNAANLYLGATGIYQTTNTTTLSIVDTVGGSLGALTYKWMYVCGG